MTSWRWASATRIGSSHLKDNGRVQDAHWVGKVHSPTHEYLACVVSDGAGSASYGGQGASLICREISRKIRQWAAVNLEPGSMPSDELLQQWVDETRDRIFLHAEARAIPTRSFAATMILLLTNGTETKIAHIGDGAAVVHLSQKDCWFIPMWPDHGEYASTTYFLTDDPEPRLRIDGVTEAVDAVCLFTDGLERLALDFTKREPHEPFFKMMFSPLGNTRSAGRNKTLSNQLGEFLMSETVTSRTDDDKTLVLAQLE